MIDDVAHAEHVVRREIAPLPRRLDHARRDAARPLDEFRGPDDRHRVAAQRDLDSAQPRQLDEVAVIHAGERQRVGALGGQVLCDCVVTHFVSSSILM